MPAAHLTIRAGKEGSTVLTAHKIVHTKRPIELHGFTLLPELRQSLASVNAIMAVHRRGSFFSNPLRFAGVWYCVTRDGFIDRAVERLGLRRLVMVRQLSYLSDPITTAVGPTSLQGLATHNRLAHSVNVALFVTLIASRYLKQRKRGYQLTLRLLQAIQIAALIHDIMTPAGGDGIKAIDPEGLDEDVRLVEFLARPYVRQFLEEVGIDPALILAILHHQGVLGQLLDLCDKIAYVATDLECYIDGSVPVFRMFCGRTLDHHAFMNFLGTGRQAQVCSLWEVIELTDQGVVCRSPLRLARFLETRLLLFRQFYLHPLARLLEVTFVRIAAEALWKAGVIDRDRLLETNDNWVDYKLNELIGFPGAIQNINDIGACRTLRFATEAQCRDVAIEAQRNGSIPLAIENVQPFMKRATHFQVRVRTGAVGPLATHYPAYEARLRTIERIKEPWLLYILDSFSGMVDPAFIELVRRHSQELMAVIT